MSTENHYKQLGLNEDATFDEIQAARNRLTEENSGDPKRQETIEAAYDAILMERLRMRQEGKIKVPEGIRFAERLAQAPPPASPAPVKESSSWLQGLLDTPSRADILWPAGIFSVLAGLTFYYPPSASGILAAAVLVSLYFLSRKEGKLGRAVVVSLSSLTGGLLFSAVVNALIQSQFPNLALAAQSPLSIALVIQTWVTLFILWLVTSFLR
ncbi:CPP1-like family protein [Planktothrix sp. FACHB-1355]|uniref:CPP1-like family protein n=1 Tax=Aerosakkonema funiforme FACHB-1375 TaxID=2949571 RepID=A0A926VBN0_9CYAN|nr:MULTISPECIES: CPP1-like family protein [Oscillatoriales]MBD2180378.1 CPP1-like family protein [Aerosakkonema funiforme FACHB-1375]MBD3557907.1 CPP1-like family protein [Planktothrix sp. FACHB-1355]